MRKYDEDKINVIVAEDVEALRRTWIEALEKTDDINLLGDAENGSMLVDLCRENPPDIAVLDIRMPVMDGVQAAKILKKELPDVKLLILTTFDDEDYLRQLFAIGINGYMLKTVNMPLLADTIRNVFLGIHAIDAGVTTKIAQMIATPEPRIEKLTDVELKVATLMVAGAYNKDIANELNISYGRTRNIVSMVYKKTNTMDRRDLAVKLADILDSEDE
ncbi:MAG: response regulator transcription factor [Clostridiales Family XIII bacterium]|jgi:DNA-binding NarL/FixJ family response regulator|nr:response regulator transcription factor [Clostridiales Family XIII bacterium]